MGYHTDFEGQFNLDRPLTPEHAAYLAAFSNTRRMARDPAETLKLYDPVREAVGLPVGPEGSFYVGEMSDGLLSHNHPPGAEGWGLERPEGWVKPDWAQPGLWCHWVPNEDHTAIVWDGGEKFYCYTQWLNYLIANFLWPWGYRLNGEVSYQGESGSDRGTLLVVDNVVHKTPSAA